MKGDSIAGRYRVDRVLGSGSSGFVVAARHIHSREKVALKVLTNGAAPPAVELPSSAHIARVLDTGYTVERQGYIATELFEGHSLKEIIKQGPVSPRLAVGWIRQACAGLAVAHAAGLVHGSLKPQNIFLTSEGIVKLLDFGMTTPLVEETDQEASAAWLHSPAYLAPEQLRDTRFDPRADVWALGVILHQLIAGALPFESETIAGMFVAVAYDEPKPLLDPDVPFDLANVVKRCLAKNAAERPSIAELIELLAPFAPAESMPPQLAMTIEDEPVPSAEPVESAQVIEPSPASRMKLAFERSVSRPPPLSRLGATSRVKKLVQPSVDRISREITHRVGRGWLAARLMAQTIAPDARTPAERDFQRRRWGAVGVVAAAAVLGIASIFASPAASAAPTALATEAALVAEAPLDFGLGAVVPASFALPEREEPDTTGDRAPTPPAALPVRWTPPPRTRLLVRDDPYHRKPTSTVVATGFTHPRKLQERRGR